MAEDKELDHQTKNIITKTLIMPEVPRAVGATPQAVALQAHTIIPTPTIVEVKMRVATIIRANHTITFIQAVVDRQTSLKITKNTKEA